MPDTEPKPDNRLLAQLGRLRGRVAAATIAALAVAVALERLSKTVPPALTREEWASNPLTPYAITAFNAFLIVGLAALGILIVLVVVSVILRFFRCP